MHYLLYGFFSFLMFYKIEIAYWKIFQESKSPDTLSGSFYFDCVISEGPSRDLRSNCMNKRRMWRFDFNQTTRTHPLLLIIRKWYLLFFTSQINVFPPTNLLLLLRVHVINYMYYIFPLNVCFKLHLALKSNVIIKITFEIIAMIHLGFISFFFFNIVWFLKLLIYWVFPIYTNIWN